MDVDELAKLEQVTYVGTRWTVGLAHEAALKQREAASAWTEAYPAMDYRHGPIAIAQPGRGVWIFGEPPAGLLDDVTATGATVVHHADLDPMASLVVAQRVAVAKSPRPGPQPRPAPQPDPLRHPRLTAAVIAELTVQPSAV